MSFQFVSIKNLPNSQENPKIPTNCHSVETKHTYVGICSIWNLPIYNSQSYWEKEKRYKIYIPGPNSPNKHCVVHDLTYIKAKSPYTHTRTHARIIKRILHTSQQSTIKQSSWFSRTPNVCEHLQLADFFFIRAAVNSKKSERNKQTPAVDRWEKSECVYILVSHTIQSSNQYTFTVWIEI